MNEEPQEELFLFKLKWKHFKILAPIIITVCSTIFGVGFKVGGIQKDIEIANLKQEKIEEIGKISRELTETKDLLKNTSKNTGVLVEKVLFLTYYLRYLLTKDIVDRDPSKANVLRLSYTLNKLCDYIERRKKEVFAKAKETGDFAALTVITTNTVYNLDGENWPLPIDVVKELQKREME